MQGGSKAKRIREGAREKELMYKVAHITFGIGYNYEFTSAIHAMWRFSLITAINLRMDNCILQLFWICSCLNIFRYSFISVEKSPYKCVEFQETVSFKFCIVVDFFAGSFVQSEITERNWYLKHESTASKAQILTGSAMLQVRKNKNWNYVLYFDRALWERVERSLFRNLLAHVQDFHSHKKIKRCFRIFHPGAAILSEYDVWAAV